MKFVVYRENTLKLSISMLVIIVDYHNKLVTKNQSTLPHLKLRHTK